MPTTPAINPALTVTQPASAAAAASTSSAPGQTDFLKLLVTQLSHQDPLAPQNDTQFVTQLAQFAALEQAQNQTKILTDVKGQLGAQAGTQAADLLGKTITARFDTVSVGSGTQDPLQFTLDNDASAVTLILRDGQGNVVRTVTTGALKAGPQAISWDGKGDGGTPLPAGNYQLMLQATGRGGGPVGVRNEVKGPVTGVSYAGGVPELIVGGGALVQLGNVIMVSK